MNERSLILVEPPQHASALRRDRSPSANGFRKM